MFGSFFFLYVEESYICTMLPCHYPPHLLSQDYQSHYSHTLYECS